MSLPYDLRGQTTQAIRVLKAFTEYTFEDEQIAQEALKYAKGLVFMTQIKAGFIWSGSMAAGIVIARMPNGDNAAVYGRDVSVGEIFSGQVEPFPEAAELHALVKAFVDGSLPAAGSPADRQAEVETQTDGTGASALEPDS